MIIVNCILVGLVAALFTYIQSLRKELHEFYTNYGRGLRRPTQQQRLQSAIDGLGSRQH